MAAVDAGAASVVGAASVAVVCLFIWLFRLAASAVLVCATVGGVTGRTLELSARLCLELRLARLSTRGLGRSLAQREQMGRSPTV